MGKVTLREAIASISILAIMCIIGVIIGDKINDNTADRVARYNKALKVRDTELFVYSMNTSTGDTVVEGELIAVDPVTFDEVGGEYMYIEKVKEVYTMHTRTVTTTDSDGKTHTKTETYWTWDYAGTDTKSCDTVNFLGVDFPSSKFSTPSTSHIDTQKVSSLVRYKYYGAPTSMKPMSALMTLKDGTIQDDKVTLSNATIEQLVDSVDSNFWLYVFWIVWLALSGGIIYYFCYAENDWLNN